jgi:MinD superfamily P-loop ATPase
MERVAQLAAHFKVPTMLCVNKCDINREMTGTLHQRATELRMKVAGEIPYDISVTRAQIAGQSIVEFDGEGIVACEVKRMWATVVGVLESPSHG